MKTIKYSLVLLLFLFSCSEDLLDRGPLDKISESQVWADETLVDFYVTNLYSRMPYDNYLINYFRYSNWTDEASTALGNNNNHTRGTISRTSEGSGSAYWDYGFIRDCNVFLEEIDASTINEDVKTAREGEVRFMRAFAYFEMMKRYGGVPLVDVVIDPYQPIPDNYLVRAKEEEIADFIDAQLTLAIGLLPDKATPKGRINKWAAYALQARAMLWAASIAKYGTVELGGIVGIPSARANAFYTKASAAADAVIQSGKYSLFNEMPSDKSENFRLIFFNDGNSEVILEKPYDGVNIGHSWDEWCAPNSWSARGDYTNPTLEFIMGFENIDGSTTQPEFGTDNLYDDAYAPFENKDPRLHGTVFFNGDVYPKGTIETWEGIDPGAEPDPSAIIIDPSTYINGRRAIGLDSRLEGNDDTNTNTGFTTKKFTTTEGPILRYDQSYINLFVFRLAEMYLTKAEAEFEMGNIDPAVTALNATRARAGISLVDASTISLEKIRTEKRSEFAWEAHRYWDLRRWRIAETVLNHRFQGLRIIYHDASSKYYFLPIDCETFTRSFDPRMYYNPITNGRIDNNPKLIENPSY